MPRQRTGFVVEKNGKIYARIQFTDASGKRNERMRRASTVTDAKRIITKLLRELDDNGEQSLDGDRVKFSELALIYQEKKLISAKYVGDRKVAGVRSVKPALVALRALNEHFGKKRIKLITHSDIETYKLKRLDTPTARGQRSIATVNRELELLRAIMRFAKTQGWLMRTPFEMGTSLISKADETSRERVLSHSEEKRLLDACLEPDAQGRQRRTHLRPLIIAAVDLGARRGELLKLVWANCDFNSRTITIIAMNSKTARPRTLPITPRLLVELQHLWEQSPKDLNGLVFGIKDTIKNSFASACKAAGIEGLRFHDLRHTAITRMVQAGVGVPIVQKISGHTQHTTFARYVNPDTHTILAAADSLAAYNEQHAPQETTELVN